MTRICETCGNEIARAANVSAKQWEVRRFCNRQCAGQRLRVDHPCRCGCGEQTLPDRRWVEGHRPTPPIDEKQCETCGVIYVRGVMSFENWTMRRYCSNECYRGWTAQVAGVMSGRAGLGTGYRVLYLPMHPDARPSYVYEHRVVMERALGRFLERHEHVHHVNEDKLDNRPENLRLVSKSEHHILHGSGIDDETIAEYLRLGWSSRQIIALRVDGHRIARVRRELKDAA